MASIFLFLIFSQYSVVFHAVIVRVYIRICSTEILDDDDETVVMIKELLDTRIRYIRTRTA